MRVGRSGRSRARIHSQIFVWAGETEPLQFKFDGMIFYVPSRNEVAIPGERSIFKFPSAKDDHGRYVPGTAVVADLIVETPEGGRRKIFDVDECCAWLERSPEQVMFGAGFDIVDDWTEVATAMSELIPLWDRSQDDKAHRILAQEMERQTKQKERGSVVTEAPNPTEVAWAVEHLSKRGARRGVAYDINALEAVLTGKPLPVREEPEEAPAPPPARRAKANGDAEQTANMAVFEEAEQLGVRLTRVELMAIMQNDGPQIKLITDKLAAKREALAKG